MEKKPGKPPLKVVGNQGSSAREPPRPLGEPGKSLWNRVMSAYAITDVGGKELLFQACAAADRVETLRDQINQEGEIIQTRQGLRDHPGLKHEIANRSFVVRTLMRLGLDVQPANPVGRPLSGGLGITRYDDGDIEED
jgi:hypothetical protein